MSYYSLYSRVKNTCNVLKASMRWFVAISITNLKRDSTLAQRSMPNNGWVKYWSSIGWSYVFLQSCYFSWTTLFQGSESLSASAVCWSWFFPRKWSSLAAWVDVQSEQWLGCSIETLATVPYWRQPMHILQVREWVMLIPSFNSFTSNDECVNLQFWVCPLNSPQINFLVPDLNNAVVLLCMFGKCFIIISLFKNWESYGTIVGMPS